MTEEDKINQIRYILNKMPEEADQYSMCELTAIEVRILLNTIDELQKEKQELKEICSDFDLKLKAIKNELIKDRMEQFDYYVIYLQDKYLKLLGEEDE